MKLVDDQGNLFGIFNLVDAVVVVAVLAIVVAGATFAFADSADSSFDTTTRYVTLDLGIQPSYVATLISEGDIVMASDTENLSITDIYATDTDDGRHLYVRARVAGAEDEGILLYGDEPLRVGRDLDLTTAEYATDGTITSVDASNPDLPVGEADVLLQTTLSVDTVDTIRRADKYRIDGRTVGTVRSVTAYRTSDPEEVIAFVGVTYQTYRASDSLRFAGKPVREGVTLPVETDVYAFEGEVVRRGATEPRGQAGTRTVRLELESVEPTLAESLQAGMREQLLDETVAELTGVSVEPATMVLTSQDGNVYRREHPVERDVTMTADLRIRETNSGVRFKGSPLYQGGTVVLDFGTVTVEATVVSVQ